MSFQYIWNLIWKYEIWNIYHIYLNVRLKSFILRFDVLLFWQGVEHKKRYEYQLHVYVQCIFNIISLSTKKVLLFLQAQKKWKIYCIMGAWDNKKPKGERKSIYIEKNFSAMFRPHDHKLRKYLSLKLNSKYLKY